MSSQPYEETLKYLKRKRDSEKSGSLWDTLGWDEDQTPEYTYRRSDIGDLTQAEWGNHFQAHGSDAHGRWIRGVQNIATNTSNWTFDVQR